MRANIKSTTDILVVDFHSYVHDYLNTVFAALETPTTNGRGRLGGSVHGYDTPVTNGSRVVVDTI